jgi:hypothetical protein
MRHPTALEREFCLQHLYSNGWLQKQLPEACSEQAHRVASALIAKGLIRDPARVSAMRDALESAQKIIERDYPNGQLAIDIRNALAVQPPIPGVVKKPAGCEPCSWPECGCQYSPAPVVMPTDAQPTVGSIYDAVYRANGSTLNDGEAVRKAIACALSQPSPAATVETCVTCGFARDQHTDKNGCGEFSAGSRSSAVNVALVLREARRFIGRDPTRLNPSAMLASINEALAALDEPQSSGVWQPIETAPKDGTWIIAICNDHSRTYRMSWGKNRKGELCWCTSDMMVSYGDGLFAPNGGWIACPLSRPQCGPTASSPAGSAPAQQLPE